jgi:hypothetical protein
MLLVMLAMAEEIAVKVHDKDGLLTGEVTVEVSGPGFSRSYMVKDDGQEPDVLAGDHLFTASATDISVTSGKVKVVAGGKSWLGDFMFEENSDPVLLIGLEGQGRAAASTHEVVFFPDQGSGTHPLGMNPPGSPGSNAPQAGMLPPLPGAAPQGMLDNRPATPKGMWLGFVVLAASMAGLGAIAVRSGELAPRALVLPPLSPSSFPTSLYLGPAPDGAMKIGEGPWTPLELALGLWSASLQLQQPVSLVVSDSKQLKGSQTELALLLQGRAELLWKEQA